MKNEVCNITFGGIGGQGIIKASEMCGWAAVFAGYHVKKSEVHGMAQRGGSVESHVRFGKKVFSPLVSQSEADFLVCFNKDEHERLKAFLSKDGVDLAEYLDIAQSQITNPRHLNTFLMGVLSAYLPIKEEYWMQALEKVFKKKIVTENKKVFRKGRSATAK